MNELKYPNEPIKTGWLRNNWTWVVGGVVALGAVAGPAVDAFNRYRDANMPESAGNATIVDTSRYSGMPQGDRYKLAQGIIAAADKDGAGICGVKKDKDGKPLPAFCATPKTQKGPGFTWTLEK